MFPVKQQHVINIFYMYVKVQRIEAVQNVIYEICLNIPPSILHKRPYSDYIYTNIHHNSTHYLVKCMQWFFLIIAITLRLVGRIVRTRLAPP